jgi:hypothetical protein
MRKPILLALGTCGFVLSLAQAADPSSDPFGLWKAFPAIYKIHSGSIADRTPPTATDRMLTVLIDGNAAKQIFDSIGPDLREACSSEDGDRARAKKGVYCAYAAQLNGPKDSPYRCWIGVNLRTGDTQQTVPC